MGLPVALLSAPLPWLALLVSKIFRSKAHKNNTHDGGFNLKGSFFPRSLKVTREGRWYIGALLLIGFAAINTGNNLLYLVVAMLLSLIIISGILSESTLRGLNVRRLLPRHIHLGRDVPIKLVITNRKKRLPSYSFTVAEAFHTTQRKADAKKNLSTEDFTSTEGYILKLPPSSDGTSLITYNFKRRGRVQLKALRIKTRFPFGLFIKGKLEETPAEVIVYPALKDITGVDLDQPSTSGTIQMRKAGTGAELHALKEYQTGEDSRHIDWKASARSKTIIRKEFEEESERHITITFKNLNDREEDFETAVIEAASLAKHYLSRDYSVALDTLNQSIPHGIGYPQLNEILHTLALITPVKKDGTATVEVRTD